ncbi:MAG: tRNA (adenosine(37)-N6)-dimethylallyltransferase MiaA [Bacteroidales bacterium]|jgi:tRNA dimethylallyltransferase|nr:tRNA (adenosine(37)-N6)-dimethylallyltransferase MiaA [Bacteroidales bacterium]MDD3701819.1 tRNA (adenosine(37)-N6)-dimethylallyltransferase MiaA [Bacteroidales bacterium]MDY0369735.1 tRNA (adenosine(37)-N6)-dimethylallyltransferase MiaA [Bacteroidales bacterium]
MPSKQKKLIVIAGPTASGKTQIAIQLAMELQTEILSADSRQFYKEMRIGTASPTQEQLQTVPHHFIGHISIHQPYNVAQYETQALEKLKALFLTHDEVILTGGSGLFIDAVCIGMDTMPEISDEVRSQVNELYQQSGLKGLQDLVQQYDSEYFKLVDTRNPRRLQRALEVYFQTGKPMSFYRKRQTQSRPFEVLWIGLQPEPVVLENRIRLRTEKMLAEGWMEEARQLFPYRHLNALNTVGYKELFEYMEGKYDLEATVEYIKLHTRQYAKRQRTWFRKNKNYHWFDPAKHYLLFDYVKSVL